MTGSKAVLSKGRGSGLNLANSDAKTAKAKNMHKNILKKI